MQESDLADAPPVKPTGDHMQRDSDHNLKAELQCEPLTWKRPKPKNRQKKNLEKTDKIQEEEKKLNYDLISWKTKI